MKRLNWSTIRLCVIFVLISQLTATTSAQIVSKEKKYAKVFLRMPLKSNEDYLVSGGDLRLEPLLISDDGKRYVFSLSGRINKGGGDYEDKFRLQVPAGRYRVAFKRDDRIRLPAFNLRAGQTTRLQVPINRVSSSDICIGGTITPRLDWDQQASLNGNENSEAGPFHDLSTDVFTPNKANEFVVNYCEMQIAGTTTVYEGVKVFFGEYFVKADRLTIDRKTGRVVASQNTWPIFIERNGAVITTDGRTFELYSGAR